MKLLNKYNIFNFFIFFTFLYFILIKYNSIENINEKNNQNQQIIEENEQLNKKSYTIDFHHIEKLIQPKNIFSFYNFVDKNNQEHIKEIVKVNFESPIISNYELKEKVENIGLKVATIDSNNINLNKITKKLLTEKEYFVALVTHAEGYIPNLYKDNSGYALGMGWNLSKQSKEFNKSIAKAIYLTDEHTEIITNISKKNHGEIDEKISKELKILPHRAIQASFLIGNYIEDKVVKQVLSNFLIKKHNLKSEDAIYKTEKILSSLKSHEKDTIIYHAYKVGPFGFQKYEKLLNNLIKYTELPTLKNKLKVASEMTYKYKENGKIKIDKRASEIVASMFLDPKIFGEIIQLSEEEIFQESNLPNHINYEFIKKKLFKY